MKRFWERAEAVRAPGGWGVSLDGKPLRTPQRAALIVPTERLARAIADEWTAVGETIDPRSMPMTGLANAAVDRVAADPRSFAATLANYAEADLACYRADGPAGLVALQAREWDWLLGWARRRFDVDFVVTSGIAHVAQPRATIDRLSQAVLELDPYRLAGLSPLVTIGGSLVAALAVLERALSADQAFAAVTLDERWQLDHWGVDDEAQAALDARREDFCAAARFIALLEA